MELAPSAGTLQADERAIVRPFASADAARWDAFVERCPEATFFHRIGWHEIIADVFRHRPHYLLAERGGRVVGVLPLAEVRSRLFGHALVSLPFCVYGGPAASDVEAERALIDEATRLAQALDVDHLELRNRAAKRPEWPRQSLYVTFRKEILPDEEANMLAIPRKQRAMVRKGIKQGLISAIDEDVDRFFALYADNAHRHGTPPYSKRYFARLRAVFGDKCEMLTVVDTKGEAVSSVLSFYFRDEVLPYYAGDSVRARDLAANDFKYWELLRRACERGLRVFDYGRSKEGTGSYDFKHNWGFVAAPLAYEYQLRRGDSIPQNNPLNPKYRALIALWKRINIDRFGLSSLIADSRIALLPPQGYLEMLGLLTGARLVLTDSGGIQEETTALNVPCLTMRDNTERPITVEQGTNTLVGRDRQRTLEVTDEIMRSGGKRGRVPELWDGHASDRIARDLSASLGLSQRTPLAVNA